MVFLITGTFRLPLLAQMTLLYYILSQSHSCLMVNAGLKDWPTAHNRRYYPNT